MTEEYYKKNIFGEVVDLDRALEEEPEEIKSGKKAEFNVFTLTDAISERNKRNAWITYERALASGLAAEEIFWRVVWGVKNILIAAKTNSALDAGMNPFVYRKSKGALNKWKVEELEDLSEKLVVGYHEARRGEVEIETFLEKILLNL
ncbi:hypothetical protein KW790_01485 [Candidatus Parcubacteria bacterium]|nr:hypothetical protein [Candidatus Parcubacteria bacterium]